LRHSPKPKPRKCYLLKRVRVSGLGVTRETQAFWELRPM
jgi:hypothetical protein